MVVDFDQHIARFQKILLSGTDAHQTLSDGDPFQILLEEIQKALKLCPTDYPTNNVLMFLLLNGDANFIDLLSEDDNFAHLIDTVPRLSQRLILRIILNLNNGLSFLKQLVMFAPCAVVVPLMDIIVTSEDLLSSTICVPITRVDLSKGCFIKIAKFAVCKDSHQKFVNFFRFLQSSKNEWIPPAHQYSNRSKQQAFRRGVNFLHDLLLCCHCLQCDLLSDKCWNGFEVLGNKFCECCELKRSKEPPLCEAVLECQNIIISKCNDEARKISLDEWLEWAEIENSASESYQQLIGKLAYTIKDHLEKLGDDPTLSDAGNLIVALSPFAIENKAEDGGPVDLSLDEIKANLVNQDNNSDGMLKLLLQHPNVLEDDTAIDLIGCNSALLDIEDVRLVFDMTLKILNGDNAVCNNNGSYKYLLYKVTKHLPFASMVELHRQFIDNFAESTSLCTPELFLLLQEAFNKTAFSANESDREWCSEFLRLSILNSSLVIRKALDVGFENPNISNYMSILLYYLRPMSQTEACAWILKLSRVQDLSRSQMDSFPPYVLELVKQDLVPDEEFIRVYALPCLHQLIIGDSWALKTMWLTSVQMVLQHMAGSSGSLNSAAAIVIYLAQIVEVCQQSSEDFSLGCIHTRGKAVEILTTLLSFEIPEVEQNWLKCVSSSYSVWTQCHLTPFWAHELSCVDFEPCFGNEIKTPTQVACSLTEILPHLTNTEWKGIASTLKQKFFHHSDWGYSVFQSFYEAVFLLVVACADKNLDENPKHMSCLQYIVSCLGDILKHFVLPALEDRNSLEALKETLLLFSKLSIELWDKAVMSLLPELMKILDDVLCDEVTVKILLSILELCPVSDGRGLLEAKLRPLSKN